MSSYLLATDRNPTMNKLTFTIGLILTLTSTLLLVMTEANAAEFLNEGYIQQGLIYIGWPLGLFGFGFGCYLMFVPHNEGLDDDLDSEFPENYEPEPQPRPDRDAVREPVPTLTWVVPSKREESRAYRLSDERRWLDTIRV